MQYLLGIDLGTSGTKTVLFDETGYAVASATEEYPLHQPKNGWAEQDPDSWWHAACVTLKKVLEKSGIDPQNVAGVSLSGQMHGLVLLDEEGKVLRPAILWCDGRTGEECGEITRTVGKEKLISISANPALTGFTAGKLLWVRRHEPEIYSRVRHVLLPKDYVRFRLTGKFYSEMSDASGTNLLDVPHRCWSREILDALEIRPELLPPLLESCSPAGSVTAEAAALTSLLKGTPVAAGAADNMAAAVGTGVAAPGRALTTIGTSGVVFAHSRTVQIDPQGRVHTFCAAVPGEYTVMSCSLAAGLSLKWYRDTFCRAEMEAAKGMGVDSYVLLNKQAAHSPIGANRLLFAPYLMGERSPLLDSNARGCFIGLSAMHTRGDCLRAVMEGVMYSQRQNLDILREMHVLPDSMIACGGGAKSPLWRQMMADIYEMPVTISENTEGPALGAAILAGVSVGLYCDIPTACAALVREKEPLLPDAERHQAYEKVYGLYRQIYPSLQPLFTSLASLEE